MKTINTIILSLILGLSFILAGLAISSGGKGLGTNNNYVTVKGLSEKQVKADYGYWAPQIVASGATISVVSDKLKKEGALANTYFQKLGFDQTEFNIQAASITHDQYSQDKDPDSYYKGTLSISIKTHNVDLLQKAASGILDLISQGVAFDASWQGPVFYFTNINSIKSAMVSEALSSAYAAAGVFTQNGKSKIGKIKSADQGTLSILSPTRDYDDGKSVDKIVRLVSTVSFYIK